MIAEQAVLVLGPSSRFLEYIAQVLPALGETAVVAATCDTLVPGAVVRRAEDRRLSEIKGRALWQPALERYVHALRPPARDLTLRWEGESYVIGAGALASPRGRPYHRARAEVTEQLYQVLTDLVVERRAALLDEMEEGLEDLLARFDRGAKPDEERDTTMTGTDVDGLMSDEEIDELRERIAGSTAIARFIETWWPTLDPAATLTGLLGDPDLLRRFAPELAPEEVALVAAEPQPWASSDIPLLDAIAELLGEDGTPEPYGEMVADRARRQRGWVYGHVLIDEAQELSEMQWHMVLRRCPSRSITAVGDIDQAEASHRHTTWAQAVAATLGERWTAAELTICYRTPSEVMELTGPVLEKAGSRNTPPRAVRSCGIAPWALTVAPGDLLGTTTAAVESLRLRWNGGTVGVIAPATYVAGLSAALGGVPVLTAAQAKGLEWDAALVVDPEGIAAGPRGWNGLYVALTRCTQELGQLRVACSRG